ncbi:uncharacterized protein LOC103937902 [Pyrus x bretschneideri]|uniref:uncharacterized protein LOC103937902 n=1 Tax=Pyrus x bretschneideri TaxID=225117 RepID=UPI002030B882|nr:uncharacterized protein LOC103937902 [Pyrus x bretschneideri]
MGTWSKEKGVLVSVYVEKPKRHHHHNHHHIHHAVKREIIHYRQGAGGKGYIISRRAELLQYSQYLRQSARSAPPSTPSSRPNITSSQQPHTHQVVGVRRKPNKSSSSKAPTCFGNWKLPNVFGIFQAKKGRKTRKMPWGNSRTTTSKIKAAVKSLKVQKQRSLFSKVFSAPTKR